MNYCLGLMLLVDRKSVEPLAAVTSPTRVTSMHQSLLHFVGQAPWSDEVLLARVRDLVLPLIERHGPIEAWIVNDTGFPKKGRHFGRGRAAILRPTRQAGQLPDRGQPLDRHRRGELADCIPAVSTRDLGRRSRAAAQGEDP
ncbi:MAG: family transposase [Rhizobium sp.]|nr:family transposase [Rhizobium sp.]